MEENKSKKPLNKFIKYTSIPFQMGITIYLGHLLGVWLDSKYGNEDELYTKIVTLIAIFLSMFLVIREVTRLTKDNSDDQ